MITEACYWKAFRVLLGVGCEGSRGQQRMGVCCGVLQGALEVRYCCLAAL